MKRWFATTLITDPESGERYPRVSPYSHPSNPVLKNYSDDGGSDKCCGLVALPNLAAVSQDPSVFIFPDVPLGVSWSTIPQDDRNAIAAKIRSFGFSFQPHATMAIKEVIELMVHDVQPGVNIENADIFDPWG